MSEHAVTTRESVCLGHKWVNREWTYDEIFEIWGRDNDTEIVPVLANKCIALENEVERLSREVHALNTVIHGEYWVWQGDGEDHLESLTCRVVVDAEQVRQWVAAAEDVKRLKTDSEGREAARFCWTCGCKGMWEVYRQEALKKWPWLEVENDD